MRVCSVPPVAGLGNVGLVAEDLRGSHGKVGIPVVKLVSDTTGQLDVANTRAEGGHGHCRNRGEAGVTVGTVVLDGVAREQQPSAQEPQPRSERTRPPYHVR